MPSSPPDTGLDAALLIEASSASLDPIRAALPELRHVTLPLECAETAPDLVSRERIGLAFCDLAEDDPRGLLLMQQVQRVHPQLPLLAVVPAGAHPLALEAFRQGAADVLFRPLLGSDIDRALQRLHGLRRSRDAVVRSQDRAARSLEDLILLKAIGATTSSEENLQRLLERVVEAIQQTLRVDIVSLMLCNDDGHLEIRAARGLPAEVIAAVRVPPGEGVAGFVLASGEPVLIDNLGSDGRFPPSEAPRRYRSGSLLSVPIRTHDRIIGVLNVNNKSDGGSFTGADQELLAMIGHQAALAIENLKLVGRLQAQSLELEQAHNDLLRLHNDRTRLVCNLSHELKTPLTSILGFSDLLLNFFEQIGEHELLEYLQRIHTESLRLERLISGMLRLFTIDSGRESWHWEPVPLGPCVEEALSGHAEAVAERELAVDVVLPDDLAPVWADRDKLLVLLDALVDNAVKFNRTGGWLRIRGEQCDVEGVPHVRLTIANAGRTVPPEEAELIFQHCAQLGDLNTAKPSGVGIGLTTCRAVLRRLHGRIALEPVAGEGTCLSVLLPTRSLSKESDHVEPEPR